jgi:hypothetical protein
MLFMEIIPVYKQNRTKYINKVQLLVVKADGTYSYHVPLKGYRFKRL